MGIEARFLAADGREVFTGNEMLVKGCLEIEGGVHLLIGYPGSPVAGFFDTLGAIKPLIQEKGIRAFQANNEALAAAALNGAQMLGCRAVAAMKSVGLHVAADALALGTLAGAHPQGGAIVITGDDPWCESTQVPADSRFLCQHLRMAVVEPGTLQEVKDWIDLSFKLSQVGGMYVGYIVTTAQADGGGSVACRPNQYPTLNTRQRIALDTRQIDLDKVLLPPRTWQHELAMPQRMEQTIEMARKVGINRIQLPEGSCQLPDKAALPPGNWQPATGNSPLGFIVTGNAGPYLEHVLAEVGLSGAFPILHMGMSWPVDVELVRQFSRLCRSMIVIEERRSFLEMNIRDTLFRMLPQEEAAAIAGRLYGKRFPDGSEGIPEGRGLNYSVLAQKVLPLIQAMVPEVAGRGTVSEELTSLREASRLRLEVVGEKLVARTATFCPGCPHRDSAALLLEIRKLLANEQYMRQRHGRGPVDLVAHGDTGCYTMLMFPPTEQLMHNYSGMGLGAGTGTGIDPFITNKQITFMGDGTFFHSGQIAITNSVKAGQDITYILLQNGTTAMTGHQDHAGTEQDMFGNRHTRQDIEQIIRGMAATGAIKLARLRPDNRDAYKRLLEEMILADGVKVVIADKECGITHRRSQLRQERQIVKEKGYLPRKTHMNVTPEVCEGCLACAKQTACPGLILADTDYGRKIDTDLTWCVNDGACERVRVSSETMRSVKPCPSFEEVTIIHSRRRRYLLPRMALDKLPEPAKVHDMSAPNALWRCHMSGVGGMGIGLVAAILVRAGHSEGYRVIFQDKKGLAIRNGGVFSQITFIKEAPRHEGTKARRDDLSTQHSALSTQHSALSTANIPYGKADLLLGVDVLEAARAVDAREQFRVASRQRTSAVLNMHKQSTVGTLLGLHDFDPQRLCERVLDRCRDDLSYVKNLSEICEQRLGSSQFVNIMMLGVAYQLGLIPVSAHAIAWAIKDTIKREHRRNLKAFNIGRKLALEPRVLPRKPQPETWEQLLTNKLRILRKTRWRGRTWAERFETLVQGAMRQMEPLPKSMKYDLALRIYDILQYQDHLLARRYVDLVRGVYAQDAEDRGYEATGAAIVNLAKVILIKDEPYVAYLLTRYEKKQRDIAKYGADVNNGDRLVYRHHTNPEIPLGPYRLRFKLKTRPWMLQALRCCTWLRRLPGWHEKETGFRDWYIDLLSRIDLASEEGYQRALKALRCPEPVSGYRDLRYPKLEAAKALAEAELAVRAEGDLVGAGA